MTMTRLQPKNHNAYVIAPTNMAEAMEYSKMIAGSCFCPANMRNKPGDVLVAIQMGAEVGLSPIQSLQNIAVINSRPCLWGDATVAVVQGHPSYVRHDEWVEGTIEKGDMTAFCSITRKGSEPHIRTFSIADAMRANLWKKPGPWVQYPARMLQMRARAFAFRDKFADALKGIQIREEVEDYEVNEENNKRIKAKIIKGNEVFSDEQRKFLFEKYIHEIEEAKNELSLKNVFDKFKNLNWSGTNYLQKLIEAKDARKMTIKAQVVSESVNVVNESVSHETDEHADFIEGLDGEVIENATV